MSPNSNSSLPFSLFEDQAMVIKQIKDSGSRKCYRHSASCLGLSPKKERNVEKKSCIIYSLLFLFLSFSFASFNDSLVRYNNQCPSQHPFLLNYQFS